MMGFKEELKKYKELNKKDLLPDVVPEKKELPKIVDADEEDLTADDVKVLQQLILEREEVRIFLAAEQGRKLFEIAQRLNSP